jgi:hypothetical protein
VTADRVDDRGSAVLLVGYRQGVQLPDEAAQAKVALAKRASPGLTRMVLDIADVDPGDAAWRRPGEAVADAPLYRMVIELSARLGEIDVIVCAAIAALAPAPVHAYRVSRSPERLDRPSSVVGATPGIKYLVLCRFHPGLPDSAARRSWNHHVPMALRVHQGAVRYVRSWIDAALTPNAPPFQGMTEPFFASREDMRDRWFGCDDQRGEIIQDIGHCLHSGERLYTSEHVLKDEGLSDESPRV